MSTPRRVTDVGVWWLIMGLVVGSIFLNIQIAEAYKVEVEAVTTIVEPKEVQFIVVTNWNEERIKKEIRDTFPEQPELAIAVFRCESGLVPTAKGPTSDYGIAQVHAPSWDKEAKRLGHTNYRTDVRDNLKMARHIYDNAGKKFTPWVCFTKKMY